MASTLFEFHLVSLGIFNERCAVQLAVAQQSAAINFISNPFCAEFFFFKLPNNAIRYSKRNAQQDNFVSFFCLSSPNESWFFFCLFQRFHPKICSFTRIINMLAIILWHLFAFHICFPQLLGEIVSIRICIKLARSSQNRLKTNVQQKNKTAKIENSWNCDFQLKNWFVKNV